MNIEKPRSAPSTMSAAVAPPATKAHWINICASCGKPTGGPRLTWDELHRKMWCHDCTTKMFFALDHTNVGEA